MDYSCDRERIRQEIIGVKQLSFVYKRELTPQAQTFVAFVNSPEGAGIIQENGGAAVKRE